MEYNPVALNEVLAFSYAYYQGGDAQANRFFVELVNTLTQSAFAALLAAGRRHQPARPSILDLGGFQYTPGDPYSGGCWDLVFTDDTPNSRPDPYRGELVQGGQFYALIPLNKDSFTASPAGAAAGSSSNSGSDVTLVPLGPRRSPRLRRATRRRALPPHRELLLRLRQHRHPAGQGPVAHDDPFAGAVPQPRGRPVQRAGDARRSPGIRACCRGSSRTPAPPGPAAQLSAEAPHPDRGEPEDEVLLGLPAPARQPVRPRVRGQSHAGRRRYALPLYRWSRPATADGQSTAREHGLFGPAVPALSRRPRRPRRGGHTGRRTPLQQPTLDARYGYTEQIAGPTGISDQLADPGTTDRPTRSTTPWGSPTTRPSPGITSRSTIATSPAWPS